MDITIQPGLLRGSVPAIPSKSYAHRALICAALSRKNTNILCGPVGLDVIATIRCLEALGAQIRPTDDGFCVTPIAVPAESAFLPCGESGSTLRFLLPIVGALGVDATFLLEGRLPERPLSPLWEEMERMGCTLSRPTDKTIHCCGQLKTGIYRMESNVSSQFTSGLLMALPLLPDSSLELLGPCNSMPYIEMTRDILNQFSRESSAFWIEGDWSNAAFFLAANALGSAVTVTGLNPDSIQGDRAILSLLGNIQVDASQVPDLIPILAVVAARKQGAHFTGIARLRTKESDRVQSIVHMIGSLGGKASADADSLTVYPVPLRGGIAESMQDHRIAMAAAIAATVCTEPVTIIDAECVKKSYRHFWTDFQSLGGKL